MPTVDASVRTSSGRRVAFAQLGPEGGAPLFFFHGNPGSRLDWDDPVNGAILDRLGIRLIGIDRPGYGQSEHQPGRCHQDWPGDVSAVADELGLDQFGILAYSAGGPYAVACALAVPERLTFVGIVSGVGPAETPGHRKGMPRAAVATIGLARRTPAVARWMVKHMSPQRFSRRFERDLAPVDREIFRAPEARQGLTKAFTEATRHGPQGLVEEMRLMGTPSGLDYTAVHCPIQLWHGDRDTFVPLRHAEHVVSLLPNANLEVLPGVGHLHRPEDWERFLETARRSAGW